MNSKLPTINEVESEFIKFADFLFSQEEPPKKDTLFIDLDCKDDTDYTDFLYDLFCYGFSKKFHGLPLSNITETHFNIIRDYLRSIGVDTILLEYTITDEEKSEITNFKIGFKPYTD